MNKRFTIQRSLVLEAVKELRRHVSADEVYEIIVKKHPDISRGTVYRNLNLLSDIGEIRKVEMPGGAALYDHMCRDHYHAKCVKCNQVFDVAMEFIGDLENNIKDTQGFIFTGHDIIFKCVCRDCNSK
ncbi:MAG: transcriptional repressor [Oscillospiraceae bacterium]|nr:transcriptional repressor [Oscillospiraceae bacterium]